MPRRATGKRPDGRKRRRRDGDQAAECTASGGGDVSGASGASSSGQGENGDFLLDFLAELDDWLDECDDMFLLPQPEPQSSADPTKRSAPVVPAQASSLSRSANLRPILPAPSVSSSPIERPKPKSSTQRQKEEIGYLRGKVQELEVKLDELKSNQQLQSDTVEVSSSELDTCSSAKLWESIAKRQQEAKNQAEKERAKLRAKLKIQLRFAQNLQALLCKPKIWEQLQENHWQKSEHHVKSDSEMFDELLRSIETRYPLMESILESNGMNRSCPATNEVKLNCATPNGITVDSKQAKVLPFDYELASEVIWRSVRQGKLAMYNCQGSVVEHSPDVLLIKSVVARPPILMSPVTVYRVVKRFVGVDAVDIVSEVAVIMSESTVADFPPLQFVNQGWGRMCPAMLSDGTAGTMMQSLMSSVLTILEPSAEQEALKTQQAAQRRHREIDMLSELIMSSYRERQALTQHVIESLLLDATLAQNTPTR